MKKRKTENQRLKDKIKELELRILVLEAENREINAYSTNFHEAKDVLPPDTISSLNAKAANTLKRQRRFREMQRLAQPEPFRLNAKRRMSHGVDRTK